MINKIKNFFTTKFVNDLKLAPLVMTIAGCGLIYQYLLANYAGRILGVMETAIFTIMTIIILFMGFGAFFAKFFDKKFFTFSILESVIGLTAFGTFYITTYTNAIANELPAILANVFQLDVSIFPKNGFISYIETFLNGFSYIMAAILGFFIGMEIPLLASIREKLNKDEELSDNIGVIYGVDYIGGAIGAFFFIFVLIQLDVKVSLAIVSLTNVFVGFAFIFMFKKHMEHFKTALTFQVLTTIIILIGCTYLGDFQKSLVNSLFKDKVVYNENTKYQNITFTIGHNNVYDEDRYSLFINGHTQFSSSDEGIYHSLLVYPALTASGQPEKVLIVGGGDGLALRDILKFNPKSVTLMDLDSRLVEMFTDPLYLEDGTEINKEFIELNEHSFSDERVNFIFGDAYLNIKDLAMNGEKFDTIIIDLPDPGHPDLNKLYSKNFYQYINVVLEDNGAVAIQSTAPYAAKEAFISIGKTLSDSGFHVDQYNHIVPSFNGLWGWTIGVKTLPTALQRLHMIEDLPVEDEWLTKNKMLSTFEWGKDYYKNVANIKVNTMDNGATYNYYKKGWQSLSKSTFE